jgi:hypothetical protein
MAHISVEKHIVRTDGIWTKLWPSLRYIKADGRELSDKGRNGGVGAVQDDRARSAQVGNADRTPHDTTRRWRVLRV